MTIHGVGGFAGTRSSRTAGLATAPPPVVAVGVGTVAAGLALFAGLAGPGHPSAPVTVLHVLAGFVYVAVGAVAWSRRPANRTGALMAAAGVGFFVNDVSYAPVPSLAAIGLLLNNLYLGVIGQLILAFPSGRLETTADRAVVGAAYFWVIVGNGLPQIVFAAPGTHDVFAIHRDLQQHDAADAARQALNILLSSVVVAMVALHYRRGTPPARRALAPAFWSTFPMIVIVIVLDIPNLTTADPLIGRVVSVLTPVALASLPIAFVAGLLRSRLAAAAIGHLVVELGSSPPREQLREALARALHDPSVTVAYRSRRHDLWMDADGRPAPLPSAGRRAYTVLERDGQPIAALIHDRSLEHDPTLVAGVAAAASLALDNERLQADVRARLAEARESRARLVTVADAERRRLERDLHDGAQQRLIALSLLLNDIGERVEAHGLTDAEDNVRAAKEQLRTALSELRDLATGIRPAILTDAGLRAALETLAENAPVAVTIRVHLDGRLPDAVEAAAYFAVCEALTNVAKHAPSASAQVDARVADGRLLVTVADNGPGGASAARGSGLRGLADRVAALDGSIDVESPSGQGTRVTIELPCG